MSPEDDALEDGAHDEIMALLTQAIGRARTQPQLLTQHGLPVPTDDAILRVTRGRAGGLKARVRVRDPVEWLAGVMPVAAAGEGRFRPALDGVGPLAVVQALTDTGAPGGEIVDMVAWHPGRPDAMRLLTGRSSFLGPLPIGWTLRVARNAMQWLCGDRWSVVVLDWGADALDAIREFPDVVVPDDTVRSLLRDRLIERCLPKLRAGDPPWRQPRELVPPATAEIVDA